MRCLVQKGIDFNFSSDRKSEKSKMKPSVEICRWKFFSCRLAKSAFKSTARLAYFAVLQSLAAAKFDSWQTVNSRHMTFFLVNKTISGLNELNTALMGLYFELLLKSTHKVNEGSTKHNNHSANFFR